ncbi:MAG TPA: D-glycero-beta-D-manno-heptose-7-phosphate kinase [Burkholderiales bacterium]|nr:D-glycero-beta-D-manno-heptose-7-phosphate kinase [Burkholderiales bacterium]
MKKTSARKKIAPAALAKARLLVVGDVMLDRYWFGEVSRISPEAPVPVVKIEKVEERPGGAANVARNVAALGAKVELLSVIGNDEASTCLQRLLRDEGIPSQLHRDQAIATTVKLRVIGRQQQLLRIDFETPPGHEVLLSKLADFEKKLSACDVVILSDYAKGGLTHIARMIALANRAGKTVLVDPKGDDYEQYRNATVLTPNRAEFRQVMGAWKNEKEFAAKARQLMRKLSLKALLVTRSEEGMTLFSDGGMLHVPAQAREVYDVSGAGDTVIAALGVMLASGADLPYAVRIANRAAGIVVGKFGTAVVHRDELFAV